MSRPQTIHLLFEELAHPGQSTGPQPGATSGTDAHAPWVEVPEGVSYVLVDESGRPRLVLDPPEDGGALYLVEQVYRDHAPRLLVLDVSSSTPIVNGSSYPPVALLQSGDEIRFGSDSTWVGHVTVFSNSAVGPPPEEALHRPCPVCLEKFDEESTTYSCSGCGQSYHAQPADLPGGEGLQCVSPGQNCLVCRAPMMVTGYSYWPVSFRGQ